MSNASDLFKRFQEMYDVRQGDKMGVAEYLDACKGDRSMYASAPERLLKAIGEPTVFDTREDPRLSRIFQNQVIRTYNSFRDFYGIETVIEEVVSFLRRAAQGLEEKKQILYFLGPVGGGKSSLADRLKELMEVEPFYALEGSPVFESPLGLFTDTPRQRAMLADTFGIPFQRIPRTMSPWARKRLHEYNGDITQFRVVRLFPSTLEGIAVAITTPGDENNQDISTLVGKVDIRQLEKVAQNDPDAYSYSGGLCRANQGILDFVEMFKAAIKTLNPLLTATQEGFYKGTEEIGALPFSGIIVAHSNESEWKEFRNNNRNEAFIARVTICKVPYCLRVTEEAEIYAKLLRGSDLATAPCAPDTLRLLARMAVLSRLEEPPAPEKPPNETIADRDKRMRGSYRSKMRAYDGESLKDVDPQAKPVRVYRDAASVDEGMKGLSTRFAFKVLARTFNFGREVSANPVHLFDVLADAIRQAQFPPELEARYLDFLQSVVKWDYREFLDREIRAAFIEAYADFGQNVFNRYITYADFWGQDADYRDPETHTIFDRPALNSELEKIEKPAGIANPKDFRNEVVNYVLRYRGSHNGQNPDWKEYKKLRDVIEKQIFARDDEILPVISFGTKPSNEIEEKHRGFVARMQEKGYTPDMVQLLVDWHLKGRKNS